MAPPFCHLHVHTDFSMLDGLGKPTHYVDEAERRGDPFLSITDHGTLSGVYEFYMACMKAGIKPGIGCEFYFVPRAETFKEDKKQHEGGSGRFHVVMLARNVAGYRTLLEMNDEAHRNWEKYKPGKPIIDRSICEAVGYEEAENLIVLSGCAASVLSKKAMGEVEGSATAELMWWHETFPNFWIELQHHGTAFDRKLNSRLLTLSRRFEVPWVITNDPHYVLEDQCDFHDALLAVQTAAQIDDPDRFAFDGDGYHLKTRAEMVRAFRRYGEDVWKPGITESAKIARSIDLKIPEWDKKSWHIPKYRRIPKGRTSFELLSHLARKGLKERGWYDDPVYRERMEYELGEIESIPGFADFLLITREIIQWAVNHKTPDHPRGIRVGPARGSTAGCLVAYLVGVHKCEPIRYKLLFERFLNPARPKMPDIDTDFSQAYREEVFQHIMDEYGAKNVLPVAAFQTMKVRGAFRKLATAMGMPFNDLSKYTQMMDEAWGKVDEEDDEEEDHIRVENLPDELVEAYPELVEYIEGVLGTKSAISRHAAGVVIFDPEDPIRAIVPTMWVVSSKKFACQFDLKSVEAMGLMKQDILGLRTLDTIDEAITLIEEQTGELIEPDDWIPDEEEGDSEVYRMIREGHNGGVFQLEGGTMENGIVKIAPRRFEDIVVCTAIYRKGPILAGAPSRYIENKKAKEVRVLHEALRPVLEDTWGEMAYQEQLMQIASEVAGFDQGLVADLLAAVRFKDPEMMAPLKAQFIRGARKVSGIMSERAEKIWKMFEAQASYLFNRSHAAAYSLLTYQTARLKCWWPLQYHTALMRTVLPKSDAAKAKRMNYLAEATEMGVKILPPDVNFSDIKFSCGVRGEREWMRFGLVDVKGIGVSKARKIIEAREKCGGRIRTISQARSVLTEALVNELDAAGCLASVKGGSERNMRALEEMLFWQFEDVMAPLRVKYEKKVRLPGSGNSRVRLIGEIVDVANKKTKNNKPYMTWRIRWKPSQIFAITLWEDAQAVWDTPKGSIVYIEGSFNSEFRNVSVGDPDQVRILRYAKQKETAA